MSDRPAEKDTVREHEFDGIREFDNRLPNWWLFTLYGTIVFALGYWLWLHTWEWGSLQHERYANEMAAAAEVQLARMSGHELTDQALRLMSEIPERVDAGREIFEQFCVVCHRADGSGDVGPNLTDAYWLHGGNPLSILETVTHGVPDKGMVAWGDQLGPRRVQNVVAYVLTLKGKNLPGKAPQGITEEERETASPSPDESSPEAT